MNVSDLRNWKRRVGEKTLQRLGISKEHKDENTGNIDEIAVRFSILQKELMGVKESFERFFQSLSNFDSAKSELLSALLTNDDSEREEEGKEELGREKRFESEDLNVGDQLNFSLYNQNATNCVKFVLDETVRKPLETAFGFCSEIEKLLKDRQNLRLDYDYNKRKFDTYQEKYSKTDDDNKRAELKEKINERKLKLEQSTKVLQNTTKIVEKRFFALENSFPLLKSSIVETLFACELFLARSKIAYYEEAKIMNHPGVKRIMDKILITNYDIICQNNAPVVNEKHPFETRLLDLIKDAESKIFGRPLISYLHGEIPLVFQKCIQLIIRHGLEVEGIFRISGSKNHVQRLKDQINQSANEEEASAKIVIDENPNDDNTDSASIHDIATLLKIFLRELPDPIVPATAMYAVIDLHQQNDSFVQSLHSIMDSNFPSHHRLCLKMLLACLSRVSQYSNVNKMAARNLAIVFAPNMFRSPTASDNFEMENAIHVTALMIQHAEEIFPDLWSASLV